MSNTANTNNNLLISASFYRRKLPSSCTSLSCEGGQSLFRSAMDHGGAKCFFPLTEQFLTQSEPAYCGISTLVMTLNALSVDPRKTWKGPWRWYEESMLNCCIDLEQAKTTGITLFQFQCLARCQGVRTTLSLASQSSLEDFRMAVKEACCDENEQTTNTNVVNQKQPSVKKRHNNKSILVASYHRGTLKQSGTGHFSPIGAYDPQSDQVLIFDVARFKYGVHWVSLPLLFDAMKPIDTVTNQSRGFFLLSFEEEEMARPHQSMLFVSKMSDHHSRQQYQQFLSSSSSTWMTTSTDPSTTDIKKNSNNEDNDSNSCSTDNIERNKSHQEAHATDGVCFDEVIQFWSQNGTNWDYIWNMIKPQLLPVTAEQKRLVEELLDFINRLSTIASATVHPSPLLLQQSTSTIALGSTDTNITSNSCCVDGRKDNVMRKIPIHPKVAIFIAYIASFPTEEARRGVIGNLLKRQQQSNETNSNHTNINNSHDTTTFLLDQVCSEAELVRLALYYST